MRIIFACWALAEYQGRILTDLGAVDRLVSYWEIKDKGDEILPGYMRHGCHKKSVRVIVNGHDETERMPRTAAELERQRKQRR